MSVPLFRCKDSAGQKRQGRNTGSSRRDHTNANTDKTDKDRRFGKGGADVNSAHNHPNDLSFMFQR